jgi:hypothetical protein
MNFTNGDGVADFITHDNRLDFQPNDRRFLKQNGDKSIHQLTIYRKPIDSKLNAILNVLSLNEWNQAMKEYGYDALFHLYLKIDYDGGSCKLEKNEVVNIDPWTKEDEVQAQFMPIILSKHMTIRDLIDYTRRFMGEVKFFTYDSWENNCQVFVISILQANGLLELNPQAYTFIYQEVQDLKRSLSSPVQKLVKRTTDFAHRLNILVKGKGLLS